MNKEQQKALQRRIKWFGRERVISEERLIAKHIWRVVTEEEIRRRGKSVQPIIINMATEVIKRIPKGKVHTRQLSLQYIAERIISYVMHNEELQRALDEAYIRRHEH